MMAHHIQIGMENAPRETGGMPGSSSWAANQKSTYHPNMYNKRIAVPRIGKWDRLERWGINHEYGHQSANQSAPAKFPSFLYTMYSECVRRWMSKSGLSNTPDSDPTAHQNASPGSFVAPSAKIAAGMVSRVDARACWIPEAMSPS